MSNNLPALLGNRKTLVAFGFGLLMVCPFLIGKPISDAACYALAAMAAAYTGANAAAKFANGNGGAYTSSSTTTSSSVKTSEGVNVLDG